MYDLTIDLRVVSFVGLEAAAAAAAKLVASLCAALQSLFHQLLVADTEFVCKLRNVLWCKLSTDIRGGLVPLAALTRTYQPLALQEISRPD